MLSDLVQIVITDALAKPPTISLCADARVDAMRVSWILTCKAVYEPVCKPSVIHQRIFMQRTTYIFGHRQRGIAATVITALLVAGCATQAPQKLDSATSSSTSGSPQSAEVANELGASVTGPTVIDRRPETDKVFDTHSLWISSCDYGVYTLPEKNTVKTHVEALHDDLAALPGDPWHGNQITVTHYVAYINAKRQLKDSAYNATFFGIIPGLIKNEIDKKHGRGETCSEAQMHGGWYAGTEITNYNPPIVIEIVAAIDGKPLKVRSVYSPDTNVIPKLKQASDDNQLAAAVRKANLAFISTLNGGGLQDAPMASHVTSTAMPASASATSYATSAGDVNMAVEAQKLSTRMGCGDVHSTGGTTFAAQCGTYGVAIDCDGAHCHPTHTLKSASTQ